MKLTKFFRKKAEKWVYGNFFVLVVMIIYILRQIYQSFHA
ncbi:hypothetical protein LEP1GSC036_0802 [Leptospira weilii str. 2006001853]|uniref:Uncharacterized protein n=2 Tax=Leptospira weilii TaxID=28184 RepID=A0A828Z7Z1_9LEPT|nr:hypothetical protein LEP1GSC036_0802 [Leptospira weilii str. 2006001853]EMJ63851.1 hypothetical protein LEP1GSC051_2486 [Leptospira sp. P2653]EMN46598.1 hypothetical protein LEP1GSC086_4040 [Leptospira weilii str. LNT 1234]EMY15980.1 hypothetical protein LEP1GSC043_3575 [Leptospira weilii str. Ecochallenge]